MGRSQKEQIWQKYKLTAFWEVIIPFCFTVSLGDNFISELGPEYRCQCGIPNLPNSRIVGGSTTNKNEFPWQVAIADFRLRPICGGTILNDLYILTAAHCFDGVTANEIYVRLGIYDFTQDTTESMGVKKIIMHPMFDKSSFTNDIALVKMVKSVTLSETKRPPCLPRPGIDYTGVMGTVLGWGRTQEGGSTSKVLRKVEVPIISPRKCKRAFGVNVILSSMLCAGWDEGGKDSCEGDSGGPLLIQKDSRWHLIGIVSWGYGCARPHYPATYTRVDRFYKWLDSNTRDANFCTH